MLSGAAVRRRRHHRHVGGRALERRRSHHPDRQSRAQRHRLHAEPDYGSPQQFSDFVAAETVKFAAIIEKEGLQMEVK
jgi:hypothetical protein